MLASIGRARRDLAPWAFALFALCLGSSLPIQAQTAPQGRLSGTVRDETGLSLPGATVTLRPANAAPLSTSTTRDGVFTLDGVPSGSAELVVELAGFETHRASIDVGRSARLAVVLRLARLTDEIVVTASRDERRVAAIPGAVGIASGAIVDQAQGVNLAETLRFVPGVAAGDVSGVDDLRIAIRGAGIRATFGSRGVLLMADGFPVTEPDGQTPHFDGQIDLLNAERVEVVKGPSSAIYGGAALGGVVNVISRTPARVPRATLRLEAGSYQFGKAHLAGSTGAGPFVLAGTFGFTHLDGFREHNSLRDWAGTARADWASGPSRVSLSFLGTDASLELPGSIDRAQFEADPTQVRPIYIANDWGRENTLLRFGGRFERTFGAGHSLELDSYGQTRDLFHPIFVVIDQDARRYVGHARYRLAHGVHAFAAGVDVDSQWVDDRWFVNAGGEPAFQIRDDDNQVRNLGFYAQDEIEVGTRTALTLGVRADRLSYDLVDRLLFDGDSTDRRTFDRVSPKVGVSAQVHERAILYGNVSTGFEAPTLGEVRLPSGLNDVVDPQKAVSLEGGIRGSRGATSYDIAVYRMTVTDEILPETIDTVTVYRNVAEASHTGVEASLRTRPGRTVTVDATYAYSRFVLEDFGAFSGHRLPGIPAHMGTLRASVTPGGGWDGALVFTWASDTFVNDANTETADAYGVLSASLGYRAGPVRLFVRGNNLTDTSYTNRPQINDGGGFYYMPAPGRHGSVGAEIRW